MTTERPPQTFFVGTLKPLERDLYRLAGPLGGEFLHVRPHDPQELHVYLEPKEALRRSPAMFD